MSQCGPFKPDLFFLSLSKSLLSAQQLKETWIVVVAGNTGLGTTSWPATKCLSLITLIPQQLESSANFSRAKNRSIWTLHHLPTTLKLPTPQQTLNPLSPSVPSPSLLQPILPTSSFTVVVCWPTPSALKKIDHAVVAVGYGTNPIYGDYYLVRN